jgi:hypothetical protein
MFMACRHIKTKGLRRESLVLKGGRFCYDHSKINSVGEKPHLRFGPLQLPAPEDPAAIQLSVARINDAVINNRLDLRKAATLLNGLRIAARFIDRKQFFDAAETVQSAEQALDGSELCPAASIQATTRKSRTKTTKKITTKRATKKKRTSNPRCATFQLPKRRRISTASGSSDPALFMPSRARPS